MRHGLPGSSLEPRLRRLVALCWLLLAALVSGTSAWAQVPAGQSASERSAAAAPKRPIALAVLGDSDSHSYQDQLAFPPGGSARGGTYRASTFQWLEVLVRLRPHAFDAGAWGEFGHARSWVVDGLGWLGVPSRFPRKLDYRFNMALSGAQCADLLQGARRQVPRLLTLMNREPERWRDGMVVVRIGVNDLSITESLDALARNPKDEGMQARVAGCVRAIEQSVAMIRARHEQVRFVFVGIFNNAHWARNHERWRDPQALANIERGLAPFDVALRALAARTPRSAFLDDRQWFTRHWGNRAADGTPAYLTVRVGRALEVRNADGDHPSHATVADGHAGTVWNALWARDFVSLVNEGFALGIKPIEDDEIVRLVDPDGRFGSR